MLPLYMITYMYMYNYVHVKSVRSKCAIIQLHETTLAATICGTPCRDLARSCEHKIMTNQLHTTHAIKSPSPSLSASAVVVSGRGPTSGTVLISAIVIVLVAIVPSIVAARPVVAAAARSVVAAAWPVVVLAAAVPARPTTAIAVPPFIAAGAASTVPPIRVAITTAAIAIAPRWGPDVGGIQTKGVMYCIELSTG